MSRPQAFLFLLLGVATATAGLAFNLGSAAPAARGSTGASRAIRTLTLDAVPDFDVTIPMDRRRNYLILYRQPVAHGTTKTKGGPGWAILILSARTGHVVKAIPLPKNEQPTAAAVDERTGQIIVGSVIYGAAQWPLRARELVTVVDESTGRTAATTTLQHGTFEPVESVIVDANTGRAFVALQGGAFYAVDIRTGSVLARTSNVMGVAPGALQVVDEQTARVFASATGRRRGKSIFGVKMINAMTGRVMRMVTDHLGLSTLALDPASNRVIAAGFTGLVDVFDARTGTILHRVQTEGSGEVAIDPQTGHAFTIDRIFGNGLTELDDHTGKVLRQHVNVGRDPEAVAVDSRAHRVIVAASMANRITVLDSRTGRIVRVIQLGRPYSFTFPQAIAVDDETGMAFITGARGLMVVNMDALR